MDYIATIQDDQGRVFVTGTSGGKGAPKWDFSYGDGGPFRKLLEQAYEDGLYSTGSIGLVRDMVYAMGRLIDELDGYELSVPAVTNKKTEDEARKEVDSLPDGAVF